MPPCQPWEEWASQRNKEEEQKDTAKLTAHGSKGGRFPVSCSGQEEKDDKGGGGREQNDATVNQEMPEVARSSQSWKRGRARSSLRLQEKSLQGTPGFWTFGLETVRESISVP